jgi:hypothetical protein
MKHPIGTTQNGIAVYVDLVKSRAATHIAQQPHLLGLVKELIEQTTTTASELHIEQDMGRTIGYNVVVETSEKDTVVYARLVRDEVYTRFVKNGKPLTTQYLTIILQLDDENNYELHDTWIGRLNPPRPGSDNENAESKPYWENHAFVLEGQAVQLATATKECPY